MLCYKDTLKNFSIQGTSQFPHQLHLDINLHVGMAVSLVLNKWGLQATPVNKVLVLSCPLIATSGCLPYIGGSSAGLVLFTNVAIISVYYIDLGAFSWLGFAELAFPATWHLPGVCSEQHTLNSLASSLHILALHV